MSTAAGREDEPDVDVLDDNNDDDNDVYPSPSQVSGNHPSCPSSMSAPSSNWTVTTPSSLSQSSGLPALAITGLTHDKLCLNVEFLKYVNLVGVLLKMREQPPAHWPSQPAVASKAVSPKAKCRHEPSPPQNEKRAKGSDEPTPEVLSLSPCPAFLSLMQEGVASSLQANTVPTVDHAEPLPSKTPRVKASRKGASTRQAMAKTHVVPSDADTDAMPLASEDSVGKDGTSDPKGSSDDAFQIKKLTRDELLERVREHNIEMQGKRASKKDIIKAITQAPQLEQLSQGSLRPSSINTNINATLRLHSSMQPGSYISFNITDDSFHIIWTIIGTIFTFYLVLPTPVCLSVS
ncbi:hypothetical protein EI94DRAFT_1811896 [Lactarius quietus]|nr:hypothetical protein EI94DRAFT_1811896 [Lactarius quietus]